MIEHDSIPLTGLPDFFFFLQENIVFQVLFQKEFNIDFFLNMKTQKTALIEQLTC